MNKKQRKQTTGFNLPAGYVLLGKYDPITSNMHLVSIGMFLVALGLCSIIIHVIRPEFDIFGFVPHLIVALGEYSYRIKVLVYCFFSVIIAGFAHEAIHGICHWVFSKKWPELGIKWKKLTPYASVRQGFFYLRNKAVFTALSPAIIITPIGLGSCYVVPLTSVPIAILVISINLGASISDFMQTRWIRSFDKNNLYGFDGNHSVMYGPPKRIN